MKALKVVIHTALRDDSEALVGLRALLAQANVTPYGVYEGHFQTTPNFKTATGPASYLTWQYLPSTGTGTVQSDNRTREQAIAVTAWSENSDTLEDILTRARFVLEGMRRVTQPDHASAVELHQIRFEGSGPDCFDDKWKVYYRAEHYRIYFREKITSV